MAFSIGNGHAKGVGRGRARFDQLAHLGADGVHQFDRPALAQHEQTGGDAPQQLRYIVEALRG